MCRVSPIFGFLCRFVIVFGLLIAPWPGWPEAYARCLQKSATTVYGSFGSKGIVRFVRSPDGDKRGDTIVYVANRDKLDRRHDGPSVARTFFDSRAMGYFPTAFLIALALATNLGWRRRLCALAWGLLWIHLFIALLLGLAIITLIGACPSLGVVDVPLFWWKFAWFIFALFSSRQAAPFAMAGLIWMVVTFRRDDWPHIFGKEEADVDHMLPSAAQRVTPCVAHAPARPGPVQKKVTNRNAY